MRVEKVYYTGKCFMTVDMDYVDDRMYDYLMEILGIFKDKAFEEFDLENKWNKIIMENMERK